MLATSISKLPPKFRREQGGCDGCRNRHIRCDKGLPGCAQCVKKGVECLGYEKQYKFVDGPSVRATARARKGNSFQKENDNNVVNQSATTTCSNRDGGEGLLDNRNGTVDMPISPMAIPSIPVRIPVSLFTFNHELSEDCRQKYFLDFYFAHIANRIFITEGPTNPFGEDLKQYIARSYALNFAVIAMSALHLAKGNLDKDEVAYAWHYRIKALRILQDDLHQQSYSVEMLAAVLFLGMTESLFDARNSGGIHLRAAKHLLFHTLSSGVEVPSFLTNFLCWFETMASFVSDDAGAVLPSPSTYAAPITRYEEAQGDHDTKVDPLVGIWGSLIPLVGQVGTIVRQLRKGSKILELKNIIDRVEIDLLQWEHPQISSLERHEPQLPPATNTAKDLYNMAEAYRLSALVTLYNYSPHLIRKRATLLEDVETASEFLSRLTCLILGLLKQIPIESRLWHVSSIPILSAGQFVTESCDRDFLRTVTDMLKHKFQLSTVEMFGNLLEVVWQRRDAGSQVWWMDVLDETGNRMLIN